MKNISKREKIILAVVAIVLLYAVVDVFVLGDGAKSPSAMDQETVESHLRDTDALVASVSTNFARSGLAEEEVFIIERAGLPWPRDPFFVGMPQERAAEVSDDVLLTSFTYTGYVVMGGSQVAIVNGVDYRVGEELEEPGFVLQSVTPRHVVIEHVELRQRVTVPFMEDY